MIVFAMSINFDLRLYHVALYTLVTFNLGLETNLIFIISILWFLEHSFGTVTSRAVSTNHVFPLALLAEVVVIVPT